MTHEEAAAALGLSRGSVGAYVSRGVKRLRGRLGPAGFVGAVLAGGMAPERAAALALTALVRGTAVRWLPAALIVAGLGLAAGGVGWMATRDDAPITAVAPPPAARESLQARNLRLFDADVRPALQAALDGMAVGDGGHAELAAVEAHGARVWVSAEVRHGPPQTHVSRFELIYDTHGGRRVFLEDALGTGHYRSANPRDPLMLTRNRVGAPDRTRPDTGLRAVEAAFRRLPADPRTAAEKEADRAAVRAVLARHVGDWPGGRRVEWPTGWYLAEGAAVRFRGGPVGYCAWSCVRLQADGGVVGWQPDAAGPFVLSADGRRIDWGGKAGSWVRDISNGGD